MKFNPKFKPFTQKIQNYNSAQLWKNGGRRSIFDDISCILILAIFPRRRWRFFQRIRLMSRQMERMRRIVGKRNYYEWIRLSFRTHCLQSWQASVGTGNVIGCGIYQDELYHLAMEHNFAGISGHKSEIIPCFFYVKTACIFNSLNSRRVVFTVLPDFSDFNKSNLF